MKKIILIILVFISANSLYAQQKGHYLAVGANLGNSQLLESDEANSSLGYGITFDYSYMFNKYFGFGVGLNYSVYRHESTVDYYYTELDNRVDDIGRNYTAQVTIEDWRETQNIEFVEIPVVAIYHYDIIRDKIILYGNMGVKFQMPVKSDYKAQEGVLDVKGYYPDYNLLLEDVPNHGFYRTMDDLPIGELDLDNSIALTASVGVIHPIGKRISLYGGLNFDYGFNNICPDNVDFVTSENISDGNKIYTTVNSGCNTMSVVFEFGCRYRL